jgi:2'-hydroxyisoflavone reductase
MNHSPSRRQILAAAGASAASLALAGLARAQSGQPATRPATPPEMPDIEKAANPISILILGGTGFIGPHEVQYARARGHKVTIANRGRTRPEMFQSMDVEHIEYDRDQEPTAIREAVAAGQKWDCVIDNVGYLPRQTQAAAEALKDAAGQYIFISSISVYQPRGVGPDEDSPVEQMPDDVAATATMQQVNQYYGALKARCEQTAEQVMPGRATIVRPGLIVGPGDPTDRFTYWPARVLMEDRCGGKMLVAGTAEEPAPVQVIDVRDLAMFLMTLAENKTMGKFNAIGPTEKLTSVVEAAKAHSGASTEFVFVPMKFLMDNNVGFWSELPMVVPSEGETAGFSQASTKRAFAAGLKPRSIQETTEATVDWWKSLPEDRRARIWSERSPVLKEAREQELLDKWAAAS